MVSGWLLIGVIGVSALVCPTMMLIGRRRGGSMPCSPATRPTRGDSLDELRRRQTALSEEITRRSDHAAVNPPANSPA